MVVRASLVAIHEGQEDRDEAALRQRTGKEVGTLQQTNTAVHKRRQLHTHKDTTDKRLHVIRQRARYIHTYMRNIKCSIMCLILQ